MRTRRDVSDLLDKAEAKTKEKSARNGDKKKLTLESTEEQAMLATKLIRARAKVETWSAKAQAAEAELLPDVCKAHRAHCKRRGFLNHVVVPAMPVITDKGVESDVTPTVSVIFQDRFSSVPTKRKEAIRRIVGKEAFGDLFEAVTSVSVKPEFSGEDELEKLIEVLGEARFLKVFDVSRTLKPTEAFSPYVFKHLDDAGLDEIEELVPRAKPSVRTK